MATSLISLVAGASLAVTSAMAAQAQGDWPNRPVTLMNPFAAGGGSDPVARLMADGLSERLGQPVVVEFHPGAGGTVGTNMFLNTEPDGYTLLFSSQTPIVNAMFTSPDLPYDPTDLVPIVMMTDSPTVVVANADVDARDLGELLAYAKDHPGEVNAGVSGAGTVSHLAMSLIQYEAGVEFNVVPYTGSGAQLADLMSGVVDIGVGWPAGFLPGVESGRLRMLGTMGKERLDLVPDVPTTAELGYPEIVLGGWLMMFAQEGTPDEIIQRVNQAANDFLQTEEAQERLHELGFVVIDDSTPQSAAEQVERDRRIFQEVWNSGVMDMNFGQ